MRKYAAFMVMLLMMVMFGACKKDNGVNPQDPIQPAPTPTVTTAGYCGGSAYSCTPTATPSRTLTFTPTYTRTATPTGTITVVIPGTGIVVVWGAFIDDDSGPLTQCSLGLVVNGMPESTAGITIIGSNATTNILPFVGYDTSLGVSIASYNSSSINCDGGFSYVFRIWSSAGNAAISVIAPGGYTFADATDTLYWLTDGTEEYVFVRNDGYHMTYELSGDLTSPISIPMATMVCDHYYVGVRSETWNTVVTNATVIRGFMTRTGALFDTSHHTAPYYGGCITPTPTATP